MGVLGPRQQSWSAALGGGRVAGQHHALGVEQCDRVPRADFRRHAITQQAVDGKFAQHFAGKQALVEQWNMQFQHARRIRPRAQLGEHRLAQFARQRVIAFGVARAQHFAAIVLLGGMHAGPGVSCLEAAPVVEPADRLQFGELADQRLGAAGELCCVDFMIGRVARHAHQLLLTLQQAQPKTLLGVLDIVLDRLLLTADFFGAQIPKGRHDGRQEQQHGGQRGQHRERVLQGRRLTSPPAAPPCKREDSDSVANGNERTGQKHGRECRGRS